LDKYLSFKTDKIEEEIRDIEDLSLETTKLVEKMSEVKEKIDYVELAIDGRVKFVKDCIAALKQNGIKVKELKY
jgi:CRISPR-associated protein Csh2